jgi:prepilin-type N-terminal cleavage/methylation domain-containing protein
MSRAAGYALIEMVIVIIIVGVLAAFIGPILTETLGSYEHTSRNIEVLTKMRYAMDRMGREIHSIRRDPANSANYDIVTGSMSASKLEFCNGDGTRVTIDNSALASEVQMAYSASASPSTCSVAAGTAQTLTDAVTTFCFSYCLIDGTTCTRTAACAATASVVDKSTVAFVDVIMTLTGTGTGAYANTLRIDLRNP